MAAIIVVAFFFLTTSNNNALLVDARLLGNNQTTTIQVTTSMTPTSSTRTNVCDRQEMYNRGEINIRDALRGLKLNPAFGNWGSDFFTFYPDEENGGGRLDEESVVVELVDELAKRAGFFWRQSYGVYYLPTDGMTWTDLLYDVATEHDFVADYWYYSLDRLKRGVTFLPGWHDGTYIMVGEQTITSKSNFYSWLQPFDGRLWLMIFITILCSGSIFWSMSNLTSKDNPPEQHLENPTNHYFLPALALTGHFEFHPIDLPSMIFTLSLALMSILLMAAYTSNLVSYFVVQQVPSLGIETIQDAISLNLPICLWEGTESDVLLTRKHPTFKNFIRIKDHDDLLAAARTSGSGGAATCQVAVTDVNSWESSENQRERNPNCQLKRIGRSIHYNQAGIAVKADAGSYCTSLVNNVLSSYMEELKLEGFVDSLLRKHFRRINNQECSSVGIGNDDGGGNGKKQITIKGVGGVFISQLTLTTLAILVSLGSFFWKKKKKEMNSKEEEEEEESLHDHDRKAEELEPTKFLTPDDTSCLMDSMMDLDASEISGPDEPQNLRSDKSEDSCLVDESQRCRMLDLSHKSKDD